MSSMVMNWLTENFCAVLADVIGGFLDVFGDVVNNIFYWIIQVATENVYVINAERFTVSLATTLISVCVVKNIIAGYFLETDYDAEEDPFNLLVRIAQTEAFILNGNWIFNFLLILQPILLGVQMRQDIVIQQPDCWGWIVRQQEEVIVLICC